LGKIVEVKGVTLQQCGQQAKCLGSVVGPRTG
jgi:hypothetical protein